MVTPTRDTIKQTSSMGQENTSGTIIDMSMKGSSKMDTWKEKDPGKHQTETLMPGNTIET